MDSYEPQIIPVNPAIGDRGDLHVYFPKQVDGPMPFVLGIHGGSWQNGSQASYSPVAAKICPLGLALALTTYRLSPEHTFPTAYNDLLAVLQWLSENGEKHGLDTSRCALFGSSAGGHLVMLLATRALAEKRPAPKIRGVAQFCGIMDLTSQYHWDLKRGQAMTHAFMGGTPEEKPEAYKAASPYENVRSGMPPIWMFHGTADSIVPISQSRNMVARLREYGNDVIYHEAYGLPHTMREPDIDRDELVFERDLMRFFQRTLAKED